MALIKCKECGKEISDQAISCPHCGCPLKTEKIKYKTETDLSDEEVIEMLDEAEKMFKNKLSEDEVIDALKEKYKISIVNACEIASTAKKSKSFALKIVGITFIVLIVGFLIVYNLILTCPRCKNKIKNEIMKEYSTSSVECTQKDRDGKGRFLYSCTCEYYDNNETKYDSSEVIALRSLGDIHIKYRGDMQLEQFFKQFSCWGEKRSNGINCMK